MWPFLKESLPLLLSGIGSQGPDLAIWSRISTLPAKLAYTYGSALIVLVGFTGLVLTGRTCERLLLASWGGMLVVFSTFDFFFNFLLKHHYFVIPVIAVGCGLVAAELSQKKRWGRVLATIFVVYILVMGGRMALSVALGEISGA